MKRKVLLNSTFGLALVVVVVVSYFGWRFISKHMKKRDDTSEYRQILSSLASRYNAVTNWQSQFDEYGIKIGKGHRSVYTSDIESAILRDDDRPLLIVGYVFEVRKGVEDALVGVKAFEYPDLNFLLNCKLEHADVILAQPTDDGEYFAVVATIASVSRPGFETDVFEENDEGSVYAEIIVEPGDQYILHGRCLDVAYVGDYKYE